MKYNLTEVADLIEGTWGPSDVTHWLRKRELIMTRCKCNHNYEHHIKSGCDRLGCNCKQYIKGS